jgi:hypothetical protein
MTSQTLKELIEVEYERCQTISEFKKEVFRLLDLYELDKPVEEFHLPYNNYKTNKVPYYTICGCNPANGGSGVCGCTVGNKLVSVPNI